MPVIHVISFYIFCILSVLFYGFSMPVTQVVFLFSTLQGSDTANSFSVYGREVEIITSKPNDAISSQTKTGSNKVR
jgi:hypothetical protein